MIDENGWDPFQVAEPDYDKRTVWENLVDPGAWNNLLQKFIPVAQSGKTLFDIFDEDDESETTNTVQPVQNPTYNPNLTAGSFSFTPYWPLIIIGVILLIIALIMRK